MMHFSVVWGGITVENGYNVLKKNPNLKRKIEENAVIKQNYPCSCMHTSIRGKSCLSSASSIYWNWILDGSRLSRYFPFIGIIVNIFPDRLTTISVSSAAELHLYRILKKFWRFLGVLLGSRGLHQKTGFWFLSPILGCTMQQELDVLLTVCHVSKIRGH